MFKKDNQIKAHTPNTIVNIVQLRKIFQEIRQQGYSFVTEEYRIGVCCIAVPIFYENGNIAASIGFSLPTARMNSDVLTRMIGSLKGVSEELRLPMA